MLRSLRRALPRLGRWPRLGAAGICLLLALDTALGASHDHAVAARTVGVVVAARFVPAGQALTAADLALARWPIALRPDGTRSTIRSLVGERAAGPIAPREPITSSRLVGADLSAGLPAGESALTVSLDDPRAGELVHRGDRVDLLAAPLASDVDVPSIRARPQVDTVAEGVLVLDVLAARDDDATELIIAADPDTTLDITGRRSSEAFTAVVVSP
jgi:pilus assembly protein CpaB